MPFMVLRHNLFSYTLQIQFILILAVYDPQHVYDFLLLFRPQTLLSRLKSF